MNRIARCVRGLLLFALAAGPLGSATLRAADDAVGPMARPMTSPRSVTPAPSDSHLLAAEDPPVDAARKALQGWWKYPWYNSETDDIQRIDLPERRQESSSGSRIAWDLSWLDWLAWFVLAVFLLALTYFIVRTFLQMELPSVTAKTAQAGGMSSVEALPFLGSRRETDLLAAARLHYEQGDYGEAIIYLFSYELMQMDAHQIVRLAKGKTNRQYLRESMTLQPLGRVFASTMVAFEEVFFGDRTLDRAGFEVCWSRLGEFESLVARGAS